MRAFFLRRGVVVSANQAGKLKTFMQMVALGMLLIPWAHFKHINDGNEWWVVLLIRLGQISKKYENYTKFLPEKVTFVTSQELENLYPEIPAGERENKFAKDNGAIFIMQIGKLLESKKRHDGRAPDYDDYH